jgi:hypothetical protein
VRHAGLVPWLVRMEKSARARAPGGAPDRAPLHCAGPVRKHCPLPPGIFPGQLIVQSRKPGPQPAVSCRPSMPRRFPACGGARRLAPSPATFAFSKRQLLIVLHPLLALAALESTHRLKGGAPRRSHWLPHCNPARRPPRRPAPPTTPLLPENTRTTLVGCWRPARGLRGRRRGCRLPGEWAAVPCHWSEPCLRTQSSSCPHTRARALNTSTHPITHANTRRHRKSHGHDSLVSHASCLIWAPFIALNPGAHDRLFAQPEA